MFGSMIGVRRESTAAPMVIAVLIWIANRILGNKIYVLAKVESMCLKLLILYRTLTMRQYFL